MKTSAMVWTLSILLIFLAFGWYIWLQNTNMQHVPSPLSTDAPLGANYPSASTTEVTQPTATTTLRAATTTQNAPTSVRVAYDGKAFSPKVVTVAKGGTVIFEDSVGQMWVASDPEPTHSGYDGTTRQEHCTPGAPQSFDQCIPGSSFSFTFTKAGTFSYHDHINLDAVGTILVK